MSRDDRSGFAAYVASVRRQLHREAYRLCGDWHEAEDLVQVTLYKIYRRWDGLTERGELGAYTRRTLMYTYISEHRHLRWRREISHASVPDVAETTCTTTMDDRLCLASVLAVLGPRQRAAVVLRFCVDLDVQQTAKMLGCSPATIRSQTHRALATLRSSCQRSA